MSQSIYQFIDLQRVDPPKKPLKIHKIGSIEVYEPLSEDQTRAQADRYPSCGSPYYKWECSIHDYIPNWLKLANEGRIFEAAELSHQTNTLPEVYGRVCPQGHLCEGSYTLSGEFGAATIGSIERYINDKTFEMGWRPDMSGVKQADKKIAIIGASPAGLACMDVLTCNRVKAIVFGRHPETDGLLTFGIPAFGLEREIMTRRRGIFTGMGIKFKLNTEMGRDVQLGDLLSDYDAVFLSVGTYQSVRDGLENEGVDGVYVALPFLIANTKQLVGLGETRDESFASVEGEHMVVLGGGDTAVDCVRTFMHQGVRHVTCIYRHDEGNMPDSRREVKSAWEGSVEFKFNIQPLGIEVSDSGKVSGVKTVRTKMGGPDVKGHHRAEIVTGSEHTVPADTVIMAFGFRPHSMGWLVKHSVELDPQGRIIALEGGDNAFQTSNLRIFVGGDIVRGSDLVVTAITEGHETADDTMNWLEV